MGEATPKMGQAMSTALRETLGSVLDMIKSAEIISKKTNPIVLVKGGHSVSDGIDLLYDASSIKWIESKRIDKKYS